MGTDYEEVFTPSSSNAEPEERKSPRQWLGGLLANRSVGRNSAKKGQPGNRKAGRAPPKERPQSNSTSPDESTGARQRGRPRLDPRDETAAEVPISHAYSLPTRS